MDATQPSKIGVGEEVYPHSWIPHSGTVADGGVRRGHAIPSFEFRYLFRTRRPLPTFIMWFAVYHQY